MPTILDILKSRWREIVAFVLPFRIFESLLLIPPVVVFGHLLNARANVSSSDFAGLLFSFRGALALILAAAAVLTLRVFEQAGLSLIFLAAAQRRRPPLRDVLSAVWRTTPSLLGLAMRFAATGVALALPFLLVGGFAASRLLRERDISYYLEFLPPEFTKRAALALGIAAVSAVCALVILTRWRLATQAALFQRLAPGAALNESVAFARGAASRILSAFGGLALIACTLLLIAAWAGDLLTGVILRTLRPETASDPQALAALLALRFILNFIALAPVTLLSAWSCSQLFRERARMMAVDLDLSVFEEPAANSAGIGRRLGRAFAWVAPPAAAAAALAGMLLAVAFIPRSFPARVAALGGAATRADPHTLAAIEDAIAMNVDAVQLNVRLSGDGVPFVASDSLAGSAAGTDVLENVAYEKIRDISLPGVGSNPRIEYPPRLDEVLELARDKTWLILDLRAPAASLTRSNGLVERVIEVVQTARVASQVSLQSTNAAALSRARQLAPEIPVGSILPDSILDDDLPETAFMALPARDLRPADAHVARTRKLTLHAVMNDGNVSEDLDRLILSSQADVLVTAAPERALEALERARQLPPFRRALRRAHGWLIR